MFHGILLNLVKPVRLLMQPVVMRLFRCLLFASDLARASVGMEGCLTMTHAHAHVWPLGQKVTIVKSVAYYLLIVIMALFQT